MAGMTHDEVLDAAATEGFELAWRPVGGNLCVGFVRGDDERYPAFGEERLAISYMRDWLRRGRCSRDRSSSGEHHACIVVAPTRGGRTDRQFQLGVTKATSATT